MVIAMMWADITLVGMFNFTKLQYVFELLTRNKDFRGSKNDYKYHLTRLALIIKYLSSCCGYFIFSLILSHNFILLMGSMNVKYK